MLYETVLPYFFELDDPGNVSGLKGKTLIWHHNGGPSIDDQKLFTPSNNPSHLLPHLLDGADGFYRVATTDELASERAPWRVSVMNRNPSARRNWRDRRHHGHI
jgi:hypothetical protein